MTVQKFLTQLIAVLDRPGMFSIQRVEDIYTIFLSEILFHKNEELEKWSADFSNFVKMDINENFNNFHWARLIRLYSGSDAHSLELFRELCLRFMNTRQTE